MFTECHDLLHFRLCSRICRRPGHNGSEFLRFHPRKHLLPDNRLSVLLPKTEVAHSYHSHCVNSPATGGLGLVLVAGAQASPCCVLH